MSRRRSESEWKADAELTRLFIAERLGPKPRRVADQEEAIRRASDELDAMDSEEAVFARRMLAIEYTALALHRRRGGPTQDDWQAAIAEVEAAGDEDVRRRARGGMSIRAAQGGWKVRVRT